MSWPEIRRVALGEREISFEAVPEPGTEPAAASPTLTAVLASRTFAAEEFRLLRAKLKALAASRSLGCVGVVSASAGEGKSLVSLGLAHAMAQEPGRRVLLVEADLRKPALEGYLGLARGAGLGEWLDGSAPSVRTRSLRFGFELLPAGSIRGAGLELLGSPRMASLLAAARSRFDAVVVDCPPLMPVADAVVMQDLVDGFLFVVRFRHSPREAVQKALSHLKTDRVLGLVYNGHHEIIPGESSYAYRRYGQY